MDWNWYRFNEIPRGVLYSFLKLRSDVFVVEQNCVFSDMDGYDPKCEHLCGLQDGELIAYLRLLPPGVKYGDPSLGRLVVDRNHRRAGHARTAMALGLQRCRQRFPRSEVVLQAQAYLAGFYAAFGFAPDGAEYVEDGIPHVDMRRPAGQSPV